MKIASYFQQLLPDFDRHQVTESIEDAREAIDGTVIASLVRMEESGVSGKEFKSREARTAMSNFDRAFPRMRGRPFVPSMLTIFNTISENLSYMESQVSRQFSSKVTRESLTYRRTAVLQLTDLANFVAEYATRQLNYLLELEFSGRAQQRFIKPQIQYLQDNERLYLQSLEALFVPRREFVRMLDSIPDIAVEVERADVLTETVGAAKLDPFKMGFINQRMNPVYRFRSMRAEGQVKQHQARKAERQMLELRLLAMREAAADGTTDAKLQQQMDYLSGRIQSVQHDIARFEEQYG